MATVVASEAASRAGMKNRPGERCTERRNRAAREVLDPATGTARAGDLPSAGLVMRQSGEPRRAHAHSATAWLHRLGDWHLGHHPAAKQDDCPVASQRDLGKFRSE